MQHFLSTCAFKSQESVVEFGYLLHISDLSPVESSGVCFCMCAHAQGACASENTRPDKLVRQVRVEFHDKLECVALVDKW